MMDRDSEPLGKFLRSRSEVNRIEIARTVRWVGFSALGIFLTLTFSYLLLRRYESALVTSVGIIPIVISLTLMRRGALSMPSTLMATTIVLIITGLATLNQGAYDIGVLGYPVILIVAGLILKGRVIIYLTLLIIACMAWLVFGDAWNLYRPLYLSTADVEDFFIGSFIILVAGNTVFRLARNVYHSLNLAERELRMRRQAEKDREAVIEELKSKNQELDRFAIRVSHDLKTPLITIAGFLGYLEKDIKEGDYEKAGRDFTQINDAAKKMGTFVDELLDLARVGRIANPPTDVPFEEIVEEALKAAKGPIEARQVRVKVDAPLPSVRVDRARAVQVMQNLISNAVKFMGDQPHPEIRIGCEERNGGHIFSVSDNGIGIPPEHHKNIFELFVKLEPQLEGTGIGLGLVKRIIEAHNGQIWVESEPGKGATFFFTLANTNKEEIL
jgi:signal transduction histidine kinase